MSSSIERKSPSLRLAQGARTRRQILSTAADVASAEGLEGLSIGRLASRLGMSKSGLFAHFGSKEQLQLATVDAAAEVFENRVVEPSTKAKPGIARLSAMLEAWQTYIQKCGYRGGCFFAAASAEFDGRPGPVRGRIAEWTGTWLRLIEQEAGQAKALGHLRADIDAAQLAFELHAFVQEANWAAQLLDDRDAFDRAARAVGRRLEDAATAKGREILAHD